MSLRRDDDAGVMDNMRRGVGYCRVPFSPVVPSVLRHDCLTQPARTRE
jgi:hypothetical protein